MGEDFFEQPPRDVASLHKPRPRPPWAGPPPATFAGLMPLQRTVVRSDAGIIVLVEMRVYPTGCSLDMVSVGRNTTQGTARDRLMRTGRFRHDKPDEPFDTRVHVGVQFADGRKATTVDPAAILVPESAPQSPVLHVMGGTGYSMSDDLVSHPETLWLWPLPPADPFDLVVEWPAFDIPLTRVAIDGAAVVDAAKQSVPYWQS